MWRLDLAFIQTSITSTGTLANSENPDEMLHNAVLPEPSLVAYMKYGCRCRLRPKFRSLAFLDTSVFISGNCSYVRVTVKHVLSGNSKRRQKFVFKTHTRLMQVKSIAECSEGSILHCFQPSLSYHLSIRPLFCLFLSGHLRQVKILLYCLILLS